MPASQSSTIDNIVCIAGAFFGVCLFLRFTLIAIPFLFRICIIADDERQMFAYLQIAANPFHY